MADDKLQQKRIERVNRLVAESMAMEAEEAREAGALGFMARALVQATMPHKDCPGSEFVRKNGAFTLSLLAPAQIGLPYGALPRLLVAWVTTEAIRTGERRLVLGDNLSGFMQEIGLVPTGGRWGSIGRIKNQMRRLFASSVCCIYDDPNPDHWAMTSVKIVEHADLWWSPKNPEQGTLWESTLILGESFFTEALEHPVPIDIRALRALRRSPMALDIYCWLTYRMSYLRKPTLIPWFALEAQFGADYSRTRAFREAFLEHLKSVLVIYPGAKVEPLPDGLELRPSPTHVTPRHPLSRG